MDLILRWTIYSHSLDLSGLFVCLVACLWDKILSYSVQAVNGDKIAFIIWYGVYVIKYGGKWRIWQPSYIRALNSLERYGGEEPTVHGNCRGRPKLPVMWHEAARWLVNSGIPFVTSHAQLFLEHDEVGQSLGHPRCTPGDFIKLWQISTKTEAWMDECTLFMW